MLFTLTVPLVLVPGPLHAITHAHNLPASPCMSIYQPTRRAALGAATAAFCGLPAHAARREADYSAVAADLSSMIKADPDVGPTLLRLAWHSSGTFDKISKTGGSKGGTIRFKEELAHGGNAGLHKLVDVLEPIKARYPDVSYADMYTLAGKVAIESAGGPQISWRKPTPHSAYAWRATHSAPVSATECISCDPFACVPWCTTCQPVAAGASSPHPAGAAASRSPSANSPSANTPSANTPSANTPPHATGAGRVDDLVEAVTPDGRLPNADTGHGQAANAHHLRYDVFYRMGFGDREIVALSGAHALGRAHPDASGYSGPWTPTPNLLNNNFFTLLLNVPWHRKVWDGPEQYEDPSGKLMMLPSDMVLVDDPKFRKFVEIYAADEAIFRKDFAKATSKLFALGTSGMRTVPVVWEGAAVRDASPPSAAIAGAVLSLAAAAAVGAAAVAKGEDGQWDGPGGGCILFEGEQVCGMASPDGACVLHAEKGWVCA